MESHRKTMMWFVVFISTVLLGVGTSASTIVPPPVTKLPTVPDDQQSPKSFPHIPFDSRYRRDERMETLYYGIRDMKMAELDKRVALALRMEPLIFLQALLSIYVFLNHIVEGLLPESVKQRIRVQNLFVVAAMHISELSARLSIPRELVSRRALFAQEHIVHQARKDMMNMVRGREGQQVAYALICLLCGMPVGCVLPVVIRDVPLLLKAGGIISLLCNPSIREEKTVGSRKKRNGSNGDQWLEDFYVLDVCTSNNRGEQKELVTSSPLSDLVKNEKRKKQHQQQQQQQTVEFDFRSSKNFRVMIDLVCESASLGMEAMLLSSFLLHQFTDFQGAKTGLPVVLKRLVCAALIVRYLQVRGMTLSELVVETLTGSKTLETIRGFTNQMMSSSSLLSTAVSLFTQQKKDNEEEEGDEVEEEEVEEEKSSKVMEDEQEEVSTIAKDDDVNVAGVVDGDHSVDSITSNKVMHSRADQDSIDQKNTDESSMGKKARKPSSGKKAKKKKSSSPTSKRIS